jgi:hypothetical protein
MRPARLLLFIALFCLCAFGRVATAQDDEVHLLGNEVRLEGRIKSVAEDQSGIEVEVVVTLSPSGRRTLHGGGMIRQVKLGKSCYIYDRFDRTVFFSRKDLKEGDVVVVQGEGGEGDEVTAQQIMVGGTLPKVTAPKLPLPNGAQPENPEDVHLPGMKGRLAKWEPATGCYLGAFEMRDENVGCSMSRWEQTVKKGHASYLRFVGYGQPFPSEWVKQVRSVGGAPNIAFEPNDGLQFVADDSYLRGWAKAAGQSGGPVFLRFGSEMNGTWTAYSGDPKLYRTKFRVVARVFRQEAPNVAMVWTPYCTPKNPIPAYYPGDDAVDWVGVNIYSVHHHNGDLAMPADKEDPLALLQPIYDRYAKRKPIQISEYAATNFCQACQESMPEFAINKMRRMYSALPTRFPRVKMIYWFSWDTISGGAAENNYAVTGNEAVLSTYRHLTQNRYFLPRIVINSTDAGGAQSRVVKHTASPAVALH